MISDHFQSHGSNKTLQHTINLPRARSMSVIRQPSKQNIWESVARKSPRSDTVLMALQKKEELKRFVTECTLEQFKQLFVIEVLGELPLMHLVVLDKESNTRDAKIGFLIENKYNPNTLWAVSDDKYVTPLHLAVESIHVLAVMALIDRGGADPNVVGKYRRKSYRFRSKWHKKTPLDVAEPSLADYLKRKGGKKYRDLSRSK